MFGGCGTGRDASFGDLNKYCTKNKAWTRLEVYGESPPAREAHVCQVIGDLLIIHGGLNQNEDSFDDMWILFGLGKKVDKVQAEMAMSNQVNQIPAMALQFNLRNSTRSLEQRVNEGQFNKNEALTWRQCDQIGQIPEARDSHSSCIVNDKIYIYGGQGKGEVFFNDIYCVRIIE